MACWEAEGRPVVVGLVLRTCGIRASLLIWLFFCSTNFLIVVLKIAMTIVGTRTGIKTLQETIALFARPADRTVTLVARQALSLCRLVVTVIDVGSGIRA